MADLPDQSRNQESTHHITEKIGSHQSADSGVAETFQARPDRQQGTEQTIPHQQSAQTQQQHGDGARH